MRRLRDLSIRFKMLGLLAVSSFLSLTLAGTAMIVYDLVVYKTNSINALTTQAQMLGAISSAALAFNDPKAATEYLATLRARPNTLCAAIYKADGNVFAVFEQPDAAPCGIPPLQPIGHEVVNDELVLFEKIEQGRERIGTVYLRQRLNRAARVLSYAGIVAVLLLGALLLGLLAASAMQRVITQPLLEMARVARGVTERSDFSLRAAKASNDEVGLLAEAFNQMLAQTERGAAELRRANEQLQLEIDEHRRAREEVVALNASLEQRVAQRTQQLELANKELESFSYSVSHDLRTPLRAIEGFSAAFLRDNADRLDERGRDHLQRVRAATRRMGRLIDDLLNLARTMRTELRRKRVDLSQIAASVASEIAETRPEQKAVFEITPGLAAYADEQLMRAVLDNLLGNAAKFSSRKSDARVEFGWERQLGETVYFVRDNGVGFNMAYANKLFGAFQRLHASSEFEGTGVGLASAQRIIARHGGRIWAEGEPGRGATFYFTLPT